MKMDLKSKKIKIKNREINLRDKKTLLILGTILLVVILVIGIFTKSIVTGSLFGVKDVKETNLSKCASVSITDGYIKLNTKAVSREKALESNPYTFNIKNECKNNGYNFYIAIPKKIDIDEESIRFLIVGKEMNEVIKEGNLGKLNDMSKAFPDNELKQFSKNIGSDVGNIYMIHTEQLEINREYSYDLYVYVDKDYSKDKTESSINLGVGLKTYIIGD